MMRQEDKLLTNKKQMALFDIQQFSNHGWQLLHPFDLEKAIQEQTETGPFDLVDYLHLAEHTKRLLHCGRKEFIPKIHACMTEFKTCRIVEHCEKDGTISEDIIFTLEGCKQSINCQIILKINLDLLDCRDLSRQWITEVASKNTDTTLFVDCSNIEKIPPFFLNISPGVAVGLTNATNITSENCKKFATAKTLSIKDTSEETLQCVLEETRNLESLKLQNTKLDDLEQLSTKLNAMEDLQKFAMENVTLKNASALTKMNQIQDLLLKNIKSCKIPDEVFSMENLRSLTIVNCRIDKLPRNIRDLKNLVHLDLSDNQIEDIPAEVCNLPKLENLKMRNNKIQELPKELENLVHLQELDLERNKIKVISEAMFKLEKLQILNLKKNKITEIPDELLNLQCLKVLMLNANKIHTIPEEFCQHEKLEELHLQQNLITDLPGTICGLISLKVLDISGNRIEHISRELGCLHGLKILNMSRNQIKYVPGAVKGFASLEMFDLSGNMISSLPEDCSQMKCLKIFNIGDNQLHMFPQCVAKLLKLEVLLLNKNVIGRRLNCSLESMPSLRILDLKNNNIQNVSAGMKFPTHLEQLILSHNSIETVPENILSIRSLRVLNLSANKITVLPSSVMNMTMLEVLKLNHNNLKDIPETVAELAHLQSLQMYQNQIQKLPPKLCRMTGLKKLNLGKNGLAELPPDMVKMKELKVVTLHGNNIVNLPENIQEIEQLEYLGLQSNFFEIFPEVLCQMKNLKILNLGNSDLRFVPATISDLATLEELSLLSNKLESLPLEIRYLKKLKSLNISNNALQEIPLAVFGLKSLERLNISTNEIQNIREELCHLGNLKELDLQENAITCIPSTIEDCQNLEKLILHINRIERLPEELSHLKKLKSLQLFNNHVEVLPASLGNLESLEKLGIGYNRIKEIPQEICAMKKLKVLSLPGNAIEAVPSSIKGMVSLEKLILYSNRIKALPDDICQLAKLKNLQLWENELREIPISVSKVQSLRHLGFGKNQIKFIPDEICSLTYLKVFSAPGNEIQEIPEAIKHMTSLEELILHTNKIKTIPKGLCELDHLKSLQIWGNNLHAVPPSICHLTSLEKLDLSTNSIDTISHEQCHGVTKLTEIDLQDNALKTIPTAVLKLTSLMALILGGNKITSIPSEIQELSYLEELYCDGNKIDVLPREIGKLTNLRVLTLKNNRIKVLPQSLKLLTRLRQLDLSYNNITIVPDIFSKCKDLENLSLQGNSIEYPPVSICDLGVSAIVQFHEDNKGAKLTRMSRKKVLLIGDTMAGKTSLAKTFSTDLPQMESEANRTQVLQHIYWQPVEDMEFQLNDFGGHHLYKIIYHMFLTEKAIALIVFDASKYVDSKYPEAVGVWLERIQKSLPTSSNILLIGTHVDMIADGNQATAVLNSVRVKSEMRRREFMKSLEKEYDQRKRLNRMQRTRKKQRKSIEGEIKVLLPSTDFKDDNIFHKKKEDNEMLFNEERLLWLKKMITNVRMLKYPIFGISCKTGQGLTELRDYILKIGRASYDQIPNIWKSIILQLHREFKNTNRIILDIHDMYSSLASEEFDGELPNGGSGIPHDKRRVLPSYNRSISDGDFRQFENVIAYLDQIGELLWFGGSKDLKDVVFTNLGLLIEVLKTIFHHDLQSHLASVQQYYASFTSFESDVQALVKCGKMSERLFQNILQDKGVEVMDSNTIKWLLKHFDLCYEFTPPGQDARHSFQGSSLFIPWFVIDKKPETVNAYWLQEIPVNKVQHSVHIVFNFLEIIPDTFFERMVVLATRRITTHLGEIFMWKNGFFCKINQTKILIEAIGGDQGKDKDTKQEPVYRKIELSAKGRRILEIWEFIYPLFLEICRYIQREWPGVTHDAELVCPHCVHNNIQPHRRVSQDYLYISCPAYLNTVPCGGKDIPAVLVRPSTQNTRTSDQMKALRDYEAAHLLEKQQTGPLTDAILDWVADQLGQSWFSIGIALGVSTAQLDRFQMDSPHNSKLQIFKMLTFARNKAFDDGRNQDDYFHFFIQTLKSCEQKGIADDLVQKVVT